MGLVCDIRVIRSYKRPVSYQLAKVPRQCGRTLSRWGRRVPFHHQSSYVGVNVLDNDQSSTRVDGRAFDSSSRGGFVGRKVSSRRKWTSVTHALAVDVSPGRLAQNLIDLIPRSQSGRGGQGSREACQNKILFNRWRQPPTRRVDSTKATLHRRSTRQSRQSVQFSNDILIFFVALSGDVCGGVYGCILR